MGFAKVKHWRNPKQKLLLSMEQLQSKTKELIIPQRQSLVIAEENLENAQREWEERKRELEEAIIRAKNELNHKDSDNGVPSTKDILDLLLCLTNLEYTDTDEYILLPCRVVSKRVQGIFDYYDCECMEDEDCHCDPLWKEIMKYQEYFESGTTKVEVRGSGLTEGRDTVLDEFSEIEIDIETDLDFYQLGIDTEDLQFYLGRGHINTSNIDMVDYECPYASGTEIVDVSYIKSKTPKT